MRITRIAAAVLVMGLLPFLLPPGGHAQSTSGEGEDDAPAFAYDGFTSLRYVYRRAEGGGTAAGQKAQDGDLFLRMRLDITMPQEQRYEAHVSASARTDVDGASDPGTYDPFEDIGDAWKSGWSAQVYEAHVDVNYFYRSLSQVRMGRQAGTRGQPIYFDGIAADLDLSKRFRATVYGGYAVHFFELQRHTTDDPLTGAGVDWLPVPATELRFDILTTRDVRTSTPTQNDQLATLRVRQHFWQHWRGGVEAQYLNGEARDARLRLLGQLPRVGLTMSASYFRQFATLNELTTDQDPYSRVIGQSQPYQTLDLKFRWQPAARYAFGLGYYGRRLLDEGTQSAFNREFTRTYLAFDMDRVLVAGLSLAVTAENWQSMETDSQTMGLDVSYRSGKDRRAARLSFGTAYQLYVYDHYLELGERTEVRTTYLRGRMPVGDSFTVTGDIEHETGLDTFDTLKIGTRYDF